MQKFRCKRPQKSLVFSAPSKPADQRSDRPGFSPLLASLLSCTLKDGLCNRTAFQMLRDIYPYVSVKDRQVIDGLIEYQDIAGDIASRGPRRVLQPYTMKRALTNREKFFGLLRTLRRYGGRRTDETFSILERIIEMNDKFSRYASGEKNMGNILQLMGPASGGKGGDGTVTKQNDMGNMGNLAAMMSMMNQMRAMGNPAGQSAKGNDMDMSNLMQMMSMMNAMKGQSGTGGMDTENMMRMMSMMNAMKGQNGAGSGMDTENMMRMMSMMNAMKGQGDTGGMDMGNMANVMQMLNTMQGQGGGMPDADTMAQLMQMLNKKDGGPDT